MLKYQKTGDQPQDKDINKIKVRCLNCAIQNIMSTIKKMDADKSRSKREACIS